METQNLSQTLRIKPLYCDEQMTELNWKNRGSSSWQMPNPYLCSIFLFGDLSLQIHGLDNKAAPILGIWSGSC